MGQLLHVSLYVKHYVLNNRVFYRLCKLKYFKMLLYWWIVSLSELLLHAIQWWTDHLQACHFLCAADTAMGHIHEPDHHSCVVCTFHIWWEIFCLWWLYQFTQHRSLSSLLHAQHLVLLAVLVCENIDSVCCWNFAEVIHGDWAHFSFFIDFWFSKNSHPISSLIPHPL